MSRINVSSQKVISISLFIPGRIEKETVPCEITTVFLVISFFAALDTTVQKSSFFGSYSKLLMMTSLFLECQLQQHYQKIPTSI
jgi:hypothetical protein